MERVLGKFYQFFSKIKRFKDLLLFDFRLVREEASVVDWSNREILNVGVFRCSSEGQGRWKTTSASRKEKQNLANR